MSNFGFFIKSICAVGENVENAIVEFHKGLNIISGPSDTGKTYIFQCINYMLGSSTEPKKITESNGYSSILMEIMLYSGENYTLKRRFGTEYIEVYPEARRLIETTVPKILNHKHDKEKIDNISAFLLEKSGYNHPIYVRTNQKGKIRTLSFRDLPMYIAISEEKVIKSHSPILSGQYTTPTVEKSIFNYLVSGIDDNNKKHIQDDAATSKTKLEGQKELLDSLILKEKEKLQGLALSGQYENHMEEMMNEIQQELERINEEIEQQTTHRRNLWSELETDKSKSLAELELIKRFKLLESYYETDLKRLGFIIEGHHYFSQLNYSQCPYCNQTMKCNGENCGFNKPTEELAFSIEIEMNKIKGKLLDLESTINQAEYDNNERNSNIMKKEVDYTHVSENIESILQPKQIQLTKLLNSYIKERDLYTEYNLINKKIEDLNNEKLLIEGKLKVKTSKGSIKENNSDGKVLSSIQEFCEFMSGTLKRWKFSKEPEVLFKDGSFFIDSKPTVDYGKGYRAIIYSGLAISLMQYCKAKNIPHPGFVVLDSPLTTYRGKKSMEDINEDIQSAFFSDLASIKKDMQIIILDNKEPSNAVKQIINYKEFTRDITNGRYGFFPVNK